jgi:hypothetical protein
MQEARVRMASIPCRNYDTETGISLCPFGPMCFYGHFDEDGVDVKELEDARQNRRRIRRQRRNEHVEIDYEHEFDFESLRQLVQDDPQAAAILDMLFEDIVEQYFINHGNDDDDDDDDEEDDFF